MKQDADLQPLYCAWAKDKWPSYRSIEEVQFSLEAHGPYSSVTPDLDQYVEVSFKHEGGWAYKESSLPALVADILRFERSR